MEFLEHMTPMDWTFIFVLDAALFLLGFLAGEDSASEEKTKWVVVSFETFDQEQKQQQVQ